MRGSIDKKIRVKINKSSILLLLYFIYTYIISRVLIEIIDLHNIDKIQLSDNLTLDLRMHIALPYTIGVFIFNILMCIYFKKNKNDLKLLFMVILNGNTFLPYFIAIPEIVILSSISQLFDSGIPITITSTLRMPFCLIGAEVEDHIIGIGYNSIIWIALGILFVFSLILYISLLKSNKRQKALDDIQNKIDSTHIIKDDSAS